MRRAMSIFGQTETMRLSRNNLLQSLCIILDFTVFILATATAAGTGAEEIGYQQTHHWNAAASSGKVVSKSFGYACCRMNAFLRRASMKEFRMKEG